MKAAVIYENGDLDQIKVDDVPEPELEEGEVLIEVKAAALNHLDIWVRKGRPGLKLPSPHILGSDACGIVKKGSKDLKHVKNGDRVLINPGVWCGACEYCLRGEQNICPGYGIIGMARPGTFAKQVTVPSENVYPVPEHLNDSEAAALPLDHLTAWRMLMSRAKLLPGETVLIHGIGGGAALAGMQIAKLAGARVLATSSSNEKLKKAGDLGADEGINYNESKDVGKEAREWTNGRGFDVIFDSVGGATWEANFKAIRRGGRIVHCGVTGGAEAQVNISALYWNQVSVLGSTMGSQEEFRQMLNAVEANGIRPLVDSVTPLGKIKQCMERMEKGEQFGKIVVTP
jgi:NADPH:quinone reductase-like Zn-dependent oxidoreductase